MAAPAVYRVPRRFITFPEDPRPYGLLVVSFLGHMLGFGAALALSAVLGAQLDRSKVYIVNLVPAAPSLGSPAAAPPAAARTPVAPKPAPPVPKAEEKPPPKAARPEPPSPPRPERTPERPPERTAEPPPPREVDVARPKTLDPSELALPRRVERDNPALPAPSRPIERSLPPPPPVSPPAATPVAPTTPPRLPEPPKIATPPAAPAMPAAPPAPAPSVAAARPSADPARPGRPNAPSVTGRNLSVDASDFPFTYYLRQLHAKVSEQWRRPPLATAEQKSAVIYFEIDRDGQIRGEPRIKQSSGNELYDQAALRAVVSSIPFPPLPREFPGQYLQVNFGFDQT
jgi:TonB family protein